MSPESSEPGVSRRGLRIAAAVAGMAAIAVVVVGIMARKQADARLVQWTEDRAVPLVAVAQPETRAVQATLDLPGRLEAYSQAQIYARVSGYVREWTADIGTPVRAGQSLAEIDAPDLDQQITQARADLASAEANAALSKATLERGQSLIASGSISKQDLDQRTADYGAKRGLVNSTQANLDRLLVLEKYKRLTAPFDGRVTARNTDLGALINAGAGGGPPLFVVSQIDKLRVYVNVPQNSVPSVRIGTRARLSVPEYPGREFPAVVEASAQAVDATSGMTRMQLVVDNASGELMTGAYVNVRLDLAAPETAINVPASALIFDQSGLHVATVEPGGRVALKNVTIARDFGNRIEIASGLAPNDRVITTPPDGIVSGDQVRVVGGSDPGALETSSSKDAPGKPPG
jgi:RND family efflux transporter MFP subunit